MKIRQAAFYEMESKRQEYVYATEAWPYIGGVVSFGFFIGCAVVMPLYKKLLPELLGCICAGMAVTYAYPKYYWNIYM